MSRKVQEKLVGGAKSVLPVIQSLLPKGAEALPVVGRLRADKEPSEIEFDPTFHPGSIYRSVLFGDSHDQTAARLGISATTLARWKQYPSVQKELSRARMIYPKVAEFAVQKAMGEVEGGDTRLLTLILKSKGGWREEGPQELNAPAESQMRVTEAAANDLLEAIAKSVRAVEAGGGSSEGT